MFNVPLFLLLPVHDTAMAGDDVPKILDLEGSLETRGEEAAERSDDGGKQGHVAEENGGFDHIIGQNDVIVRYFFQNHGVSANNASLFL